MRKLYMATLVALGFLHGSSAIAIPKLGQLLEEKGLIARSQIDAKACSDFSGIWRGSCHFNGQHKPSKVVILQDGCNGISIGMENQDSQSFIIGGMGTAAMVIPVDKSSLSVAFTHTSQWNGNYDALSAKLSGTVKVIGTPASAPLAVEGQLALREGSLNYGLELEGVKVSCSYDKE